MDAEHRITEFYEKPKRGDLAGKESPVAAELQAEGRVYLASMGIYVFECDVLYEELDAHPDSHDFGKALIPGAIGRRSVFSSPRARLPASRRSIASRPGRVGRRGGAGGASASRMSARNRATTRSRFRRWLRSSWATTCNRPSPSSRPASRRRARPRSSSVSVGEPSRSKTSSTRVDDLFACWPPGPELRR
jgi:hypothetical protein